MVSNTRISDRSDQSSLAGRLQPARLVYFTAFLYSALSATFLFNQMAAQILAHAARVIDLGSGIYRY